MQKCVFVDRDGVINIDKEYLYKIEDFEFIDGVFEAFSHFYKNGYKIVIITNQSGIARGYYTQKDYDNLTSWMRDEIAKNSNTTIAAIFSCPHAPEDNCDCRKPKIGMIKSTQEIIDIDYQNSWLIGDKQSDIQTAINAGIKNHIQVRSGHKFDESKSQANHIVDSIYDTIKLIK